MGDLHIWQARWYSKHLMRSDSLTRDGRTVSSQFLACSPRITMRRSQGGVGAEGITHGLRDFGVFGSIGAPIHIFICADSKPMCPFGGNGLCCSMHDGLGLQALCISGSLQRHCFALKALCLYCLLYRTTLPVLGRTLLLKLAGMHLNVTIRSLQWWSISQVECRLDLSCETKQLLLNWPKAHTICTACTVLSRRCSWGPSKQMHHRHSI